MTPTALIAEDEPLLAAGLQSDLARAWPGLEVVAVVGDGHAAIAEALRWRPAVCFLDIRMPGPNGIEVAQALAEDWPEGSPPPLPVFVTAYEEHALQAFETGAVDYLLKPVDAARLATCVRRLNERLAARSAAPAEALERALAQLRGLLEAAPRRSAEPPLRIIQAQVGATVRMVPIEHVVYFEAADKYVRVVTAKGEHLIRTPLKELLPRLDAHAFWQVHRGMVVRADSIEQARRDETGRIVLKLAGRSESIVVSRLHAQRFRGM